MAYKWQCCQLGLPSEILRRGWLCINFLLVYTKMDKNSSDCDENYVYKTTKKKKSHGRMSDVKIKIIESWTRSSLWMPKTAI